jgi:hypothetical protein
LRHEFRELFASLFRDPERHEAIVRTLASKTRGMTRDEILAGTRIADGGSLSKVLDELQVSGFIRTYRPYRKKSRGALYQLTDFYSAFYLRFIEQSDPSEQGFWTKFSATPAHNAWSGHAFELVCLQHIEQIKRCLGISGIIASIYSWRSERVDPGAQVDLVIDRADNVVDLCEMKFASGEFVIDKELDLRLRNKRSAFVAETGTRKAVRTVMVTTYGLKPNMYSGSYPVEVRAEALFG